MSSVTTSRTTHFSPGVLLPALLLVLLTACSAFSTFSGSASAAGSPGSPGAGSHGGAGGSGGAGSAGGVSMVFCAGTSCSVTLSGNGSSAEIFDTPITFESISDGRASLRVGDQDVSGTEGQSVSVGSLTLRFTSVTDDTVKFTASAG